MCTTAHSGWRSGTAARAAASAGRSDTSQPRAVSSAPAAASSAVSSGRPGASAPRRLSTSRWRTPCAATRWRARTAASAPPPLSSTVPSDGPNAPAGRAAGSGAGAAGGRTRRGAYSTPSRRAACGSPVASSSASASPRPSWSGPSMSSRTNRSGCSSWAALSRPQTAAAPGSAGRGRAPCGPVAPRVSTTRGVRAVVSSAGRAWTRARTSAATACTAAGSVPSAVGGQVSSTASAVAGRGSTGKAAGSTRSSRGPRRPQRVTGRGPGPAVTGVQPTWKTEPEDARSAAVDAVRRVSEPTVATVRPAGSVIRAVTASGPSGRSRTRRTGASEASSATRCQENGSGTPSAGSAVAAPSRRPVVWRAASSRAGCTPKPSAPVPGRPSGRATSAWIASAVRQAARRPRNAGP